MVKVLSIFTKKLKIKHRIFAVRDIRSNGGEDALLLVEVQLRSFLTSALDGGECLTSLSGRCAL